MLTIIGRMIMKLLGLQFKGMCIDWPPLLTFCTNPCSEFPQTYPGMMITFTTWAQMICYRVVTIITMVLSLLVLLALVGSWHSTNQ